MSNLAWIFVSTLLVNNFTLVMFLGLCSFFGVTAKIETAWRLGLANTFVLLLTAVGAWILNTYVLTKTPFLRTIAFIVVVASGVQIVEMAVKKHFPVLFRQLGIYLPLITTNCAILGLALFQTSRHYSLTESLVFAIGAGLGLTLALSLMASIRERIEVADVPVVARRMGLVLVVASCLSMAFMGFAGMGERAMSQTVLAIVLGAGLFVLFGLVPHRGCTGHCAGCTGSCGRHKDDEGGGFDV